MAFNYKARQWLFRYGPSEVAGSFAAVLVLILTREATQNEVAAGYAGAAAEGVIYYVIMLLRELAALRAASSPHQQSYFRDFPRVLRIVVLEFGAAEVLDLLLVRPFCLAAGFRLAGPAGALAGKVAADLVFYGPVVLMYERRSFPRPPSAG